MTSHSTPTPRLLSRSLLHLRDRMGSALDMVLVFFVQVVILVIAVAYVATHSSATRNLTLTIFCLGAVLAAAAWAWKRAIDSFDSRARILIAETLNRHGPLGRAAIKLALSRDKFVYRVLTTLYVNALSGMLHDHTVVLRPDGRYQLSAGVTGAPPPGSHESPSSTDKPGQPRN